jgi:hypothetical protein
VGKVIWAVTATSSSSMPSTTRRSARCLNQEPQALVSPQLTIGVLSQPEVLRQVMGVEGRLIATSSPGS